jgi:GT2 family glycosyltransferase
MVDNASTDSTKQVMKAFSQAPNLRYIYEPRLGLSYARNTAWQNARGKFVAYLDDDAMASPNWLDKTIEAFETMPRAGCVGGKTEPLWEAPRPAWLSDELVAGLAIVDWSNAPHYVQDLDKEWLVGANLAFPVEVLKKIGGFVEGLDRTGKNLLSSGDIFIEKQIMQRGYGCLYYPAMRVQHHIQKSRLEQRWFLRRYFWQGISNAFMQIVQARLNARARWRLALKKAARLFSSPTKLKQLAVATDDPLRFTGRYFTLIELGNVQGLLTIRR